MLQAEVKSLCTVKTSTLNMAQDLGSAPSAQLPPHSLPQPYSTRWASHSPRMRDGGSPHPGPGIVGLTLGMASSSRNLARFRRAARRFCCWSCRGSRLQGKGGVRLWDRDAGGPGRLSSLTSLCGRICPFLSSSARRSRSHSRPGLSLAAPCWGGSAGRGFAGERCISSF